MSLISDQSRKLNSDASGDKKIFFKGLEQCLEAFTSGEGRVVRKYARLFSQLSGKCREDDEGTISWSSSEEENGDASNSSICPRSKATRTLNSQINFDSRIIANRHGRRLTRAEFSRSVDHISQDPFGITSETLSEKPAAKSSLPKSENSQSIFNTGILLSQSCDLTVVPETSNIEDHLSPLVPLTPPKVFGLGDGITSPVFKLNASLKKRVKKCELKGKRHKDTVVKDIVGQGNGDTDTAKKPITLLEPLPAANTGTDPVELPLFLTPESNSINETYGITSPILGRTTFRHHQSVTSPDMDGIGDPSASPVMLKQQKRRKRPFSSTVPIPASPIFEPKKKRSAFKRKQKPAVPGSSHNHEGKTHGIGPLHPGVTDNLGSDSSSTVKRSLDFASENGNGLAHSENDVSIKPFTEDLRNTSIQNTTAQNLSFKKSSEDVPDMLKHNFVKKTNLCIENASENLLNATNYIEEVNSEELNVFVLPKAVQPCPNRPRNTFNKKRRPGAQLANLEKIEENSQTQKLFEPKLTDDLPCAQLSEGSMSKAVEQYSAKEAKSSEEEFVPSQKLKILDQTNLIEEVYTEDLDLSVFENVHQADRYIQPASTRQNYEEGQRVDDDNAQSSPSSPSLLEKRTFNNNEPQSKILSTSVWRASEKMQKEFRLRRSAKFSDEELIISQSSSRSGDLVRNSQTGFPVIECVSSPISRVSKEICSTSPGIISKSNSARSVVSSPLVISSAGSSPDVVTADSPFVILEDEHNAPPKRRSKKLDPNGIASRLQRLLNQRRSAARIWQYKCSKLSRLGNNEENMVPEESRGRVLKVLSVRTDYSHIVLFSEEDKGNHSDGKEFKSSILVVLDPGVVVRLARVMIATAIKIFPPWQSMDLVDQDITVILGANIVEVVSTERDTHTPEDISDKPASVQKYSCQCLSPHPPDTVILECWDGVQSIGIMDMLFPTSAPSSTQLIQYDVNMSQTLRCPDPINRKRKQVKYSIKALLSTQSTTNHGKGVLSLTVLRALCYWQRSLRLSSRGNASLHWSIFGRDDSNEVCELVLGQIQDSAPEPRCDWSDFISGRCLGVKYKFRGVAVSQRLDRSRLCGEWDIVPETQNIVYILAPSMQFSFSSEDVRSEPAKWKPDISTLDVHVGDGATENGPNMPTRVSFVCRIFHANEQTLFVSDHSISPKLCTVVIKQSTYVPPLILSTVLKPSPTKMLVFLQDAEVSKGKIVADKYSRIIVLDDKGRAYPESSFQKNWPASPKMCTVLHGIKVQLPQFSPRSRTHNLVQLTGVVSDLEETSALMWPACGGCGGPVSTESKTVHHCAQCSRECEDLIVHMSLIVFVQCPHFPKDVTIRLKILSETVQALLRTLPKEGLDIRVQEALGKSIGPIRCEVTASHGGNFTLNELPSSLWM